MKKLFVIIICAIAIHLPANSQLNVPAVRIFLEDIEGRPLKVKGIDDVEGTPFLFEDWKQGTVTFHQGSFISGVNLKFALYGNQLFFRKGEEMLEFTMPVKEFTINATSKEPLLFRALYPDIGQNTHSTFYHVLSDGRYQLLKLTLREIRDHKSYNEPVKKKFNDKESLFLFADGKISYLKSDKSGLQSLLPGQSEQIEKIIKEQKLKLKNEGDLKKLFDELNR